MSQEAVKETKEQKRARLVEQIRKTPSWESFLRAFDGRVSGCRGRCECGREFIDTYNSDYDWEEGEVEAAQAAGATCLGYAVSYIEFEGRTFCSDCDCWHERALRLIAFIDGHAAELAGYLTEEKKRKRQEADHSPVVAE